MHHANRWRRGAGRRAAAVMAVIAALAGSVLSAGCPASASRSQRCVELCGVEADCSRADHKRNFGEDECVAACTSLERDPEGIKHVDRHEECVQAARARSRQFCDDVLACP